MLKELLKQDKLGNREELIFALFEGLSASKELSISSFKKDCIANLFSIALSLQGIIKLLEFMSFAKVKETKIKLNVNIFNPSEFKDPNLYFETYHFYKNLIESLKEHDAISFLFNQKNLKFSSDLNKFYVKDNLIPNKFFPIRNLLLATDFFERDHLVKNRLFIKEKFTGEIREGIVSKFTYPTKKHKKISSKELKEKLKQQEEHGKESELYVLKYEQNRLAGHPAFEKIRQISEDDVAAGYDIESFNDKDSISIDRFIEVKSHGDKASFYWSKNEIEKAKALGDEYFLYLINRNEMKKDGYKPFIYQNPYVKVFESDLWNKEPATWTFTLSD